MKDVNIVLIGACISIITAYWTSKLTYKNEIGKRLYEKKEKVYFELFEILESLKKNRCLVFNDDFITQLNIIKPGIILFANKRVRSKFDQLYELVISSYKDYMDIFNSRNAFDRKNGMIQEKRDSGFSHEEAEVYTEEEILQEIENYQANHGIEKPKIEKSIEGIIDHMRSDLQV